MTFPKVTAREQYAKLEAAHLDRPRCTCHDEPMSWQKGDGRQVSGGTWICRIADRDRSRAWRLANPDHPRRSRHTPQEDAASRARRVARNREIVAAEVTERGAVCIDCGRRYEPRKFHWHHRRPSEKVFSVANGVIHRGVDALIAELAKCDLICSSCHPTRHASLRRQEVAA